MSTRPLDSSRPPARISLDRAWVSPDHRWTLGEASLRWLTGKHGWSPLTVTRYTWSLQRFIDDMGGLDVHLDAVTPIDFHDWVGDLRPTRGKDYAPSALNTTVAPVRAFYGWAVQMAMVTTNPTLETAPSKTGKAPPKRLTREACRRLLEVSDTRERVQETLFLGYGLRLAELTRLRVEDWDRERNLLTVLGKGSKVRILPVVGEVLDELTGWVDFVLRTPAGPMWPSPDKPGQPLSAGWIGRRIPAMGERAGIYVHCHLLRHTALADMVEEGLDLETVRTIAGHATLATLSVYTSSAPEHLRKSMAERRRSYR